jgi:hypothetical protein
VGLIALHALRQGLRLPRLCGLKKGSPRRCASGMSVTTALKKPRLSTTLAGPPNMAAWRPVSAENTRFSKHRFLSPPDLAPYRALHVIRRAAPLRNLVDGAIAAFT